MPLPMTNHYPCAVTISVNQKCLKRGLDRHRQRIRRPVQAIGRKIGSVMTRQGHESRLLPATASRRSNPKPPATNLRHLMKQGRGCTSHCRKLSIAIGNRVEIARCARISKHPVRAVDGCFYRPRVAHRHKLPPAKIMCIQLVRRCSGDLRPVRAIKRSSHHSGISNCKKSPIRKNDSIKHLCRRAGGFHWAGDYANASCLADQPDRLKQQKREPINIAKHLRIHTSTAMAMLSPQSQNYSQMSSKSAFNQFLRWSTADRVRQLSRQNESDLRLPHSRTNSDHPICPMRPKYPGLRRNLQKGWT